MAQTGFTPISLYYSSTATNVPTNTNLAAGELAINTADGKLFYKDSSGVVQVLATKGGVGSSTTTQVLYNTSGLVVGSANLTFNGTTLTTANDASISGLTVGKGGGAVASNTAVGLNALSANTSGTSNSAFGSGALNANTTGLYNDAFGLQSLSANTTGNNNTGFGYATLYSNTTGTYNTAMGGYSPGSFSALFSNTTGSFNIAVGNGTLKSNTTASYNTAVGYQAAYSNTTGQVISAFGRLALYANTTGNSNTAIGHIALYANTTGGSNTAVGEGALNANTTASQNTAVGYQAGYSSNSTGNVFLGYQAAQPGAGNYNVVIGCATSLSTTSDSYSILISGNTSATGKGSSTGFIQPGGGGVYQGNNSAAWSITSDQRLKKNIVDNTVGLSAINAIQVRNFEYRTADEVTDLPKQNAVDIKGVQLGAIAQELALVLPDCVKTESTGVMSVDTTNITWHLINAVKELNAKVTALEAQLGK